MSDKEANDSEINRLKSEINRLKKENRSLRRAVEELSVLNELSVDISVARDLHEIMNKIIHRSLRAVHAEQGVLTLAGTEESDPWRTLIRKNVSSVEQEALRPDKILLGWMFTKKSAVVINNPKLDQRVKGIVWHPSIRSVLCAPLTVRGKMVGILTIYNKKDSGGFTAENQRLVGIIAAQSAQVVENARLYEEEKELVRMRQEQNVARQIQVNLLPAENPSVPGYDIAGISIPAQTVGGDYFDFMPFEGSRLAICVGDVSGKGIPAAILMANVQATLRSLASIYTSTNDCLENANNQLCRSVKPGSFVTLVYGVLNTDRHVFHYSNAGHNRPLLLQPGRAHKTLSTAGLILGVKPDFLYEEASVEIQPDGILLIYSDGIVEAMDEYSRQFGDERLIETLNREVDQSASEIINQIIKSVSRHTGESQQSDDMTVVVIKREY